MRTDTAIEMRDQKATALKILDPPSDQGMLQAGRRRCDLCGKEGDEDVEWRFHDLHLCDDCRGHVWTAPEFTRSQILRFLTGNVC